jgi:hypothetical protein
MAVACFSTPLPGVPGRFASSAHCAAREFSVTTECEWGSTDRREPYFNQVPKSRGCLALQPRQQLPPRPQECPVFRPFRFRLLRVLRRA